jgi:hypothetical protein
VTNDDDALQSKDLRSLTCPIFPWPGLAGWVCRPLDVILGFAPRRYQRRTPGWGTGTGHWHGTCRFTSFPFDPSTPEDPARTVRRRTDKAPHGELERDGDTVPGEISQPADIAAVYPGGRDATERAGGAGGRCRHEDGDGGAVHTEQIETETRGIGKKGGWHEAGP